MPVQDHPRSRGVYVTTPNPPLVALGSSPLARGLRGVRVSPGRHRWIIPARAGFTRRCVSWWPPAWDHPRSRGVYLERV